MADATITAKYNKHIKDKNWIGLIQLAIYRQFDYSSGMWQNLVFDKSFILEFVLDKSLYLKYNLTKPKFTDMYVWRNILTRIEELGLDFTPEEWGMWIKTTSHYYKKGYVKNYTHAENINLDNKPKNFLLAYMDDDVYKTMVDALGNNFGFRNTNPTTEAIKSLTQDQKNILINRIDVNGAFNINLSSCDPTLFSDWGENTADTIWKLDKLNMDIGLIFKDLSHDEFSMFLKKKIDKKIAPMHRLDNNWLSYLEYNEDFVFSDELMDSLYSIIQNVGFAPIINNITIEQIEKYGNMINVHILSLRKSMTLREVNDRKGHRQNTDISFMRFFTEEEILENLNLFNPKELKNKPQFYVSPATYKLLNKQWGRRQPYNKNLESFPSLIDTVSSVFLNLDVIRYLIKKTGVSNEEALKAMSSSIKGKLKGNDGVNIQKFLDFYNKYN